MPPHLIMFHLTSQEDVDIMYVDKDFLLHIKEMTQGFAIIHTVWKWKSRSQSLQFDIGDILEVISLHRFSVQKSSDQEDCSQSQGRTGSTTTGTNEDRCCLSQTERLTTNTCHVHCTGAPLLNVWALRWGKHTLFFELFLKSFSKECKTFAICK